MEREHGRRPITNDRPIRECAANYSPSPWGEGWGEGIAIVAGPKVPTSQFAAAENEPFHLSLDFLSFHAWLAQAILGAMAEFADKKSARDRRMQTGQAWRAFEELFGELKLTDKRCHGPPTPRPASPRIVAQAPTCRIADFARAGRTNSHRTSEPR